MVKTSIIIPTYNEKENIESLFEALSSIIDDFEIIFVDDNSPDGTASEIESLKDIRVRLIKRKGKMGLGTAVLEGFQAAKGDYLVMMDADLSHDAKTLPEMIKTADRADIVIGSRYIKGGSIVGWPISRHVMSRVAILLSRFALGIKVKDPMSGFALFKRDIFEQLEGRLNPKGYKLLLEILVKSSDSTFEEVPTTFSNRQAGYSKLGIEEIKNYFKLCWDLWCYRCKLKAK